MSLGRQAILSVMWGILANNIGFVISLLAQLILVRLLLPEDFGTFAFSLAILETISIITAWSLSTAIINMPDEDDLLDTVLFLSILQGLILIFLSLITSLTIYFCRHEISVLSMSILFLALGRAISFVSSVYSSYLEKALLYKSFSTAKIITSTVSNLIAIVAAVIGLGVFSLLLREFLSSLVSLFVFQHISKRKFGWKFNYVLAKKLISFCNKIMFSRGFESLFYRLDSLLIGSLAGIIQLGYYSQARYVVDLANAIISPASNVVAYPFYSRIQNDENKLRESFRIQSYFLIRFTLPLSLLFILFPKEIVNLFFGEKWGPSSDLLQLLALYPVFVPVSQNIKLLLYAVRMIDITILIYGFQILIAIPLILVGFKSLGLTGAILSFMVSILAGLVAISIGSYRYTLPSFKVSLLIPFAASFLTWILIRYLKAHMYMSPNIILQASLFFLTIIVLFTLLFFLERKQMMENLKFVFSRLKGV